MSAGLERAAKRWASPEGQRELARWLLVMHAVFRAAADYLEERNPELAESCRVVSRAYDVDGVAVDAD